MNSPTQAIEYREAMQGAALAFLQRHDNEHLGNDQTLFNRAVSHLNLSLGVPAYLAEQLAASAYVDFRNTPNHPYIDLKHSTNQAAVLKDPRTGKAYVVSVESILQHLTDHHAHTLPSYTA